LDEGRGGWGAGGGELGGEGLSGGGVRKDRGKEKETDRRGEQRD